MESWGENWKVIQNSSNEYYPTGWYGNTDHLKEIINLEDYTESKGFILLHPVDRDTPAIIEFNGVISKNRHFLNLILTGSVHGDHLFRVEVNNEIIKGLIISGGKREQVILDLTEYSEEELNIKLYIYAGGQELWQYEHCFITDVFFTNTK